MVLTFDGWFTHCNESVIGFIVSFLNIELVLQVRTTGNFKITDGHSSADFYQVIQKVEHERLASRQSDFYVSDSAPVNIAKCVCLCVHLETIIGFPVPFISHNGQ